ncbi:MAG: DUF2589 domain-containing protein [Bacillota bacterium]
MAYSAGQELSSMAFDKIIGGALDAVVKAQSNSSITTVNFIKQTGFKLNDKGEASEPIYVEFKYPKQVSSFVPAVAEYFTIQVKNSGLGYSEESIVGFEVGGNSLNATPSIDQFGKIISVTLNSSENLVAGDVTVKTAEGTQVQEQCQLICVKIEKQDAVPAQFEDMSLKVPILTMLPIPFIRIATTDIELNVKINSMETSSSSSEDKNSKSGGGTVGYKGFGASVNASFNASVSSQKKTSSTSEVKKEFSLGIKVHAVQDEMPAGISRILDILEESIAPKQVEGKTA